MQNRFTIFVNSRVTSQSPKIQIIPNAGNVQVVSNVKIYAPAPAKKKSSKKKAKKFLIKFPKFMNKIGFFGRWINDKQLFFR